MNRFRDCLRSRVPKIKDGHPQQPHSSYNQLKWTCNWEAIWLKRVITLRLSRGVSKISYRASCSAKTLTEYPDAAVSGLFHACYPVSPDMCFKKKIVPRVSRHLRKVPWDPAPHRPPTGGHMTKIIFHIQVTIDLWWLYLK